MGLKKYQLEGVIWWPASLMIGLPGPSSGDVKNTNLCLMLPVSWMGAETTCQQQQGPFYLSHFRLAEVIDCSFVCLTSLLS